MTDGGEDLTRRLREGFAVRPDGAPAGDVPDADRIWQAAHGLLTAEETAELVELAVSDPATAEAWRLALELERSSASATVVPLSRWRRWRWGWLMAAAVVVLGVVVPLLQTQPWHRSPVLRNAGSAGVESRLADNEALPRSRFLLRWSAGRDGSVYDVVVSDGDLNLLYHGHRLPEPELLVPVAALEPVADGGEVLWRVDAIDPDGSHVLSPTFVQRVE